jgi:hypothetical protein
MEVVGPPLRWVGDANWTLAAANFAGDASHLPTAHGYGAALGMDPSGGRRQGYFLHTAHGHTANLGLAMPGVLDTPYLGLPENLLPELEQHLTAEQLQILKPLISIAGTVFPNFSFLDISGASFLSAAAIDQPVSFLSARQWQPRGVGAVEVWTWLFMDPHAPEWWKDTSRACYLRAFGPAGNHEQDDMENWGEINAGLRGATARHLDLQFRMGLEVTPADDWPGPGTAYRTFGDLNERAFYDEWRRRMGNV